MSELKTVRALRMGFYGGHRRRKGAEFVVDAQDNEGWFEDVGPAPEGAALPEQLQDGRPPKGMTFVEFMKSHGSPAEVRTPEPMTLTEAVDTGAAGTVTRTSAKPQDDNDLT